jgi:hyperosmotically inducible periplasmic protein
MICFRKSAARLSLAAVAGLLLVAGGIGVAQAPAGAAGSGPNDAQIQAEVTKALDNKQFKGVKSTVQSGVVTLTGTVDLYSRKQAAGDKAQHQKNVKDVENQIEVAGPTVDDLTLRNKLGEKLAYDRVGYGTTAFNALTIGVDHGVVTLGGTACLPADKDSALGLVKNYPGVKGVIDHIVVSPVSPMDDRIRQAEARAVYGTPQLNKYALDPAKPIKIIVANGNVTLLGVVDNQGDKDIAYLRANGVPGVFKVTNDLQVAGSSSEK